MSRTITLETETPENFMDITLGIKATELILRSYRVDLLSSSTIRYRDLGISIGNVVNSFYVIDNQVGSNLFRIPLQTSPAVTVGNEAFSVVSTFVPNCNIPLTMTGDLDKSFFLRVYYLDRTVTPNKFLPVPVADLKYMMLLFDAVKV
jgi:hypothetical protein